ncbi:hypothetical protein VU10_04385 [Desulfobulbus sp. US1]|nr:hypothetical protein [Desulfobulbus sp. US1]WLE97588.1 MAG: hypothetical protein QTN59_01865 [Candidatus Electrothrix communis]
MQANGNLDICYAFLGQRKKALAFFDQALEIDATYEPAKTNMAAVLSLKEGEKLSDNQTKTVEYCREVVEQMDDNNNQRQ